MIFAPMRPGRVPEGLLRGDRRQRLRARIEERSAGCGEDQRGHVLHRFADEALPDRRVLGIDRPEPGERARERVQRRHRGDGRRVRPRQRHHQVAAGDQGLLVGGRDDLAGAQRGKDRPQADDATRPDDHEVHVVADRERLEGVRAADALGAGREVHRGQARRIGQADGPRTQAGHLLGERRGIRPGGQRDDLEGLGVRGEDVDRLAPDRAGRAEQRDPATRGRVAVEVRRGRRRHTGSRPAPRTGTNRRGRASRHGPGSACRSPWPPPPA